MFNFLLFVFVLALMVIFLIAFKKDYSCPCVLFCLGFLISSFFLLINTNNWEYVISFKTVLIISSSILVFGIGCFLGRNRKEKTQNFSLLSETKNNSSKGKLCKCLIIAISLMCLLVRLLDVYLTVGSLNIFSGVLGVYRGLEEESRLASLISFCSPAISACVIIEAVELVNAFKTKKKRILFPLSIVLLGLVYFALSSSRIEILYTFVYIIIYLLIILKINNKKLDSKVFIVLLILSLLLFTVFFLAGYLTGKSQNQISMFDNISLYAGSSMATFDSWISTFVYEGKNFGITIFRGLNNFLTRFGIQLPISYKTDLGFRSIGEMAHTSNVYSCLAELIVDVGYIGTIVILFLEGFFLTKFYNKAINDMRKGKRVVPYLYIYLAPLVIFSSIAERIFRTFLTISTLAFILVVYVIKLTEKKRMS